MAWIERGNSGRADSYHDNGLSVTRIATIPFLSKYQQVGLFEIYYSLVIIANVIHCYPGVNDNLKGLTYVNKSNVIGWHVLDLWTR